MKMLISGGDRRMIFAAKKLAERYDCAVCGFEDAEIAGIPRADGRTGFDCAVLPVFTGNGDGAPCTDALRGMLRPGAAVFAGRVSPQLVRLCAGNSWYLYDYLEREELAVMNAVLTAEAAAGIAIRETEAAVFGSKVLVLGFGRIGKMTARYFSALGAQVTAAARKPSDLAWIRACGYIPADIGDEEQMRGALGTADIILNTVPAPVLAGDAAAAVRRETLLIELASVPCTAPTAHFRVIKANGLPGKVSPVTAGYIIAEAVENIIDERSRKNGGT